MSKRYMNQAQKRNDMNRAGLFSEMPYLQNGKNIKLESLRDLKLPQMYPSPVRTKTGVLDKYFDKNFKRLYENEKWKSPYIGYYIRPRDDKTKQTEVKLPFLAGPSAKRQSTPGDYYGAFGPKLPAMLNQFKPKPKIEEGQPNIKIKATNTRGSGYADITFSKFATHMVCPYDVVPAKPKKPIDGPFKPGGGYNNYFHANPLKSSNNDYGPTYRRQIREKSTDNPPFKGPKKQANIGNGFDKFPKHEAGPYVDLHNMLNPKTKIPEKGYNPNPFYQPDRNKSFYTTSITNQKIDVAMNNTNWKTYKTVSTLTGGPKPLCNS